MNALDIQGLVKQYPGQLAVNHLDLQVDEGSFFGLLGPNGAGKTTTLGCITGLVRPTAGTVNVFGENAWTNPAVVRKNVGLCAQEPNFDDFLGLERILAYHGGYFGMPYAKALDKARELLKFFDLHDHRHKRSSTLSGGMKRRLLLARALMHEPKMLILDEPTAGVDVELRRSLWEHVRRLNDEGITIVLTTHYLEEAEALCDDVAVIDQGRIIERGSPNDLRGKYGSFRVRLATNAAIDATDLGFARDGQGRWVREDAQAKQALMPLMRRIEEAGGSIDDLDVSQTKLEDVFVKLTHRGGDEE